MLSFHNNFRYSQQQQHSKRKICQFKKKKKKERGKTLLSFTLFSLSLSSGNTTYRSSPHSREGNIGIFFWFFLENLWWNRNGMEWQTHLSTWDDRHIQSTDCQIFSACRELEKIKILFWRTPFHVHIQAYPYLNNTLTIRLSLSKNPKYQQSNSLTFPSTT